MMRLLYLFYLCKLIAVCWSVVRIVSGPVSVTNATLGGTARFECMLSNRYSYPAWNIDENDYDVTDLPLGYEFKSEGYSKILIVEPLQQAMNNTCYYCFVETYEGRQESSRAKLIFLPLIYTTATSLSPVSSPVSSAISHLIFSLSSDAVSSSIFHETTIKPPSHDKNTALTQYTLLGVTAPISLTVLTFIVASTLIFYCHRKGRKGSELTGVHNKKEEEPVYEEVGVGLALHPNPSYENPSTFRLGANISQSQ